MSESRNFYVLKYLQTNEILDLKITETDVRNHLDSDLIFIIFHFNSGQIFLWLGSNVQSQIYIENAKNYANQTQLQVREQYGVDSKIILCTEGHESPEFQQLFMDGIGKSSSLAASTPIAIQESPPNPFLSEKKNDTTPVVRTISNEIKLKIEEMLKNKPDPELLEGFSYTDYVEYCEEKAPFGKDSYGKAFLFPQKKGSKAAHRLDMTPKSDLSALRNSGLGWKLYPTIPVALIFFLPCIIIFPLLYYYYGHPELVGAVLYKELFANLPFVAVAFFLVLLIGYCFVSFDDLLKPYGKDHESFKILWRDELEYLKFECRFFETTYHMNWIKLGAVAFFIFMGFSIYSLVAPEFYLPTFFADDMPLWIRWFFLINNLGIALLVFLMVTFLLAVFKGLFILGGLAEDKEKLSISGYKNMIKSVIEKLTKAQIEKIEIIDNEGVINFTGKTFYEFQRGNRKVGELLFNIAAILIGICILAGIGLFIAGLSGALPENLENQIQQFSGAVTFMAIMSFGIFVFPQLSLHKFLKEFKFRLTDSFSEMKSRLEFIYYDCLIHPELIPKLNPEWKSIDDIRTQIEMSEKMVEESKGYGTWSYDFPEILKVVGIAISTLIPLFLDYIPT